MHMYPTQQGIVAARLARFQELKLYNEDPARYSRSPQPHDHLSPTATNFLARSSTPTSPKPSSHPSRRSLVSSYVSNNDPLQPLRARRSLATISGCEIPHSHHVHHGSGYDHMPVSPLKIRKSGRPRSALGSRSEPFPNDISTSEERLILAQTGIHEPSPHRLVPGRRNTIADRIEAAMRKSPNLRSEDIKLFRSQASANSSHACETTGGLAENRSLVNFPVGPSNPSTAPLSTSHRSPTIHFASLVGTEPTGSDSALPVSSDKASSDDTASIASKMTLSKRIRRTFSSKARVAENRLTGDSTTLPALPISVPTLQPGGRKVTDVLRRFSRSSGNKSSTAVAGGDTTEVGSDTSPVMTLKPFEVGRTAGEMQMIYTSSRLALRKCQGSHENVEITDDKGNCLMVLTVEGGGPRGPVKVEMSPSPRRGRYRRCEACDRAR